MLIKLFTECYLPFRIRRQKLEKVMKLNNPTEDKYKLLVGNTGESTCSALEDT